jgi:uroporphyrin-3 C-methyltransferase
VADVESGIRVAIQQAAITGSSEPLVAVLRQSDERLARNNQPRLQGVRRAILRDLDRVRAAGSVDVAVLTIRLDEAVRLMDDLPLLSALKLAEDLPEATATTPEAAVTPSGAASVPSGSGEASWWESSRAIGRRVWGEVKSLVRVSRIDQPDSVLMAPEQSFFLRENLKLRLLNARLALLSRQFDTAQADLKVVQDALSRYFDPQSRRTSHANEVVRQLAAQARAVSVPRPDDTLAALAAAEAGR